MPDNKTILDEIAEHQNFKIDSSDYVQGIARGVDTVKHWIEDYPCVWEKREIDSCSYITKCGKNFYVDGGELTDELRFCLFCGRVVKEKEDG